MFTRGVYSMHSKKFDGSYLGFSRIDGPKSIAQVLDEGNGLIDIAFTGIYNF